MERKKPSAIYDLGQGWCDKLKFFLLALRISGGKQKGTTRKCVPLASAVTRVGFTDLKGLKRSVSPQPNVVQWLPGLDSNQQPSG